MYTIILAKVLCVGSTVDSKALLHGINAADEPRDPVIEVAQTERHQKHNPELLGAEMVWSGTSV